MKDFLGLVAVSLVVGLCILLAAVGIMGIHDIVTKGDEYRIQILKSYTTKELMVEIEGRRKKIKKELEVINNK